MVYIQTVVNFEALKQILHFDLEHNDYLFGQTKKNGQLAQLISIEAYLISLVLEILHQHCHLLYIYGGN